MKLISLIFILTITSQAQANLFQSNCFNFEQTVSYAVKNGSSELFVSLAMADGSIEKTPIMDFQIARLDSKPLNSTVKNTCDLVMAETGILDTTDLTFRKVKITLDGDQKFDPRVIGVSKDLKSLDVDYFCKTEISQTIDCI